MKYETQRRWNEFGAVRFWCVAGRNELSRWSTFIRLSCAFEEGTL